MTIKRRITGKSLLLFTLAIVVSSSASDEISICSKTKTCTLLETAVDLITKAKISYIEDENIIKLAEKPIDCYDLRIKGHNASGVYTIWPRCRLSSCRSLEVYCDMETDGGGWTIIQRRGIGFSSPESFFRDWKEYKMGFGNVNNDYWLGNENIFSLTNEGLYSIRFDITDKHGKSVYALYDIFAIDNENKNYRVHVRGYSGDAGSGMILSDDRPFSTKDRKTDVDVAEHCAMTRQSGWWFKDCTDVNLNGLHMPGVEDKRSMYWYKWQKYVGMKYSTMKIRPKNLKSFT
ncbi:Techylectin-5A, partial [Stegodyphus mimosarum]